MDQHTLITEYYTRHRDEIVGFIAMRIADAAEAEDLTQDIFLRLLSGQRLITGVTLPALVYVMASHAVTNYYRHRRVCETYEHYLKNTDSTEETVSVINARQLMERMEHSLARLPEPCQQVYRLHIYGGMKVSEIANELALPYKQVENRLGQARRTVRQQLRAVI